MKKFTYNGLGFPVKLIGVKTRKFRGETLPDINHRELEDMVFKLLLWLPARFSGAHLAFVRSYMSLSQKKLASTLGLKTHTTISGWEKKDDEISGMPHATEVIIRLLMAEYIKDKTFSSHFKEFLEVSDPAQELELRVA